ncbi:Fe(3+) ABC transporter substrate-binding protein [Sanyastnella coralliicola]|uniref:Fe(3+) ABC transporter substrate-binding protein n=1 Tax=Sanyastnella coralliicola TaxID=3069118 RepID=UPI0027B9DC91|nr:Fe(3+) ABC transporter substrate-binding protein [Longitalea sp. SCSIO 12813]
MKKLLWFSALALIMSCATESSEPAQDTPEETVQETQEVNIYSHRHYDIDQELFEEFEASTGIKVNVVKAKADELLVRLENEGADSPADLIMTSDAGRLVRAEQKGLLQPIESELLNARVAENLRDPQNQWYSLTVRARVFAYHPERVREDELTTYEDLANESWQGRIISRSSSNIYNQSLLASIIANDGAEAATAWATAVRANMARDPQGNDRAQVKAVAAGEADLAIVNTYYLGKMLNSENEAERKAGESVKLFFPNQDGRGTHINVSGAGLTKHSPNKENAIKLLEFLTSKEAQQRFADANYEYPVNPEAQASELLQSWGEFKRDSLNLVELGLNNARAIEIFGAANWN